MGKTHSYEAKETDQAADLNSYTDRVIKSLALMRAPENECIAWELTMGEAREHQHLKMAEEVFKGH